MSTRSLIFKKNNDGSYVGVYCHNDGYPTGVGQILYNFYNEERTTRLIELGSMSSLGCFIEPQQNGIRTKYESTPNGFDLLPIITSKHTFDEPQDNVCVFYNRDRNEELHNYQLKNFEDLLELFKDSWAEYVYVLQDNQWFFLDNNLYKLKSLKEELHNEALL